MRDVSSSRPRVLQVVLSLNPGGTERLVVELASRLHAGIPMAVCCLDDEGAWAGRLTSEGIAVSALGRAPGFHPRLAAAVARAARAHEATTIHAHHYSPFVYSALARLLRPRTSLVFTEHGRLSDHAPSPKRRAVNRLLGRLPHRVFTVSDDLRQHLHAEGFRPGSVDVIYNGVEAGPLPGDADRRLARARLGVPDGTLVVGTVARLDPVKDLGTLLAAAAALRRDTPVAVVIIGDGPVRSDLERTCRDLGLDGTVTFLGHRDDAREQLAGWDVYVNCSVSEGVSLTILEAMAAGLPVVATAVGGTPEVIDPSCGRLIPARDSTALADALRALAVSLDERHVLGRGGRRRLEERFTMDRMVASYRDVYARLG